MQRDCIVRNNQRNTYTRVSLLKKKQKELLICLMILFGTYSFYHPSMKPLSPFCFVSKGFFLFLSCPGCSKTSSAAGYPVYRGKYYKSSTLLQKNVLIVMIPIWTILTWWKMLIFCGSHVLLHLFLPRKLHSFSSRVFDGVIGEI